MNKPLEKLNSTIKRFKYQFLLVILLGVILVSYNNCGKSGGSGGNTVSYLSASQKSIGASTYYNCNFPLCREPIWGNNTIFSMNAETISTIEDNTQAIAVGDFNNDGNLDFVVANDDISNVSSNSNYVYLGSGDGGFTLSQTLNTSTFGNRAYAVKVADFNNDGNLDIVVGGVMVSNEKQDQNRLYLGNGYGEFDGGTQIASFPSDYISIRDIAIGDLNGDGNLDLVLASNPYNYSLLGYGDGTFKAPVQISTFQGESAGVALGDLNRDGVLDAVFSYSGSHPMMSLLGNGDGSFKFGRNVDDINGREIALADFNNDGLLDLVAPGCVEEDKIYIGDGSGGFGEGTVIFDEKRYSEHVAVGDLNNDGNLDVVISNRSWHRDNKSVILLGDGQGQFSQAAEIEKGDVVVLGDINNDDLVDFIVGVKSGRANKIIIGN